MHSRLKCLAVIVLLIGTVTPAAAGVIFADDFESEALGDNIQQLTRWRVSAARPRGRSSVMPLTNS